MSKKIFIVLLFCALIFTVGAGCGVEKVKSQNESLSRSFPQGQVSKEPDFVGEKGDAVSMIDGQILLDSEIFEDGLAHYYNTELYSGKIIYFFVVKDKKGIYRVAANACQVCHGARMGFRQAGDYMVCNTCGNKYPLEKIATEKGGCNPGPINPNLIVKDGKITIEQSDIEEVADLF